MTSGKSDSPGFGRRKSSVGSAGEGDAETASQANVPGAGRSVAGDEGLSNDLVALLSSAYGESGSGSLESTLSAIGALAGFAAQQVIWSEFVRTGKLAISKAFVVVETKSGETFFFGDFLNAVLVSTETREPSVWQFVSSGATKAGALVLPDLEPIFAHVSATVGGELFGIPRLPAEHQPRERPRDALNRFWPQVKALLAARGVASALWPLEIAIAAQRLIVRIKDRIDPSFAATIVMEAAIPMSKVDPATVPGGN